ncbi:MAG TPA: c-type cytochrome [Gammaproteobacteria bacterium]|nr:c-type cytochrome [Gammaproteobacteria bacterium]
MKKKSVLVLASVMALGLSSVQVATASKNPEKRCKACHNFTAKNKVGPGLLGVFGRKAGTMAGFKYSKSLASADWVWDEEHLRKWIKNSKKAIKEFTGDKKAKTKMPKQNMKGKKADKIIAFLKELK